MSGPIVVILAAGLGTRMKSDTAKVLHRVAGRPLVVWPVELARGMGAARIVVVLGHQLDAVRAVLEARHPGELIYVKQERQLGTGDAARQAVAALAGEGDGTPVVILYGDVPLLSAQTIERLLAARGDAALALVATRPPSAAGYGRLVRDAQGRLVRIVEDRDATAAEKAITDVNAGVYATTLGFLRGALSDLSPKNAQGELYLTDIIAGAAPVPTVDAPFDEVAGVNDRAELARLDAVARRAINERWMRAGVTLIDPATTYIDADITEIGRDVELGPGVSLRGAATRIADRVRVDAGCILTNTTVAADTVIKPYSVLTDATVGARVQIGPFSHARPGTHLEDDVHLGNFVETKKAHLGAGSKANHLAYLGDAEIGARVNVGAGTITCNYDGVRKNVTTIEDEVFIGSDSQLIAPVTIGRGAYVGAGATITKDVPPGALAITRVEQKHIPDYAERKKRKK